MSAHLSEQHIIQYRQRTLSPSDLILACEHLATCARCRAGVSDTEQLESVFDALGPSLHQSATSESSLWAKLVTRFREQPIRVLAEGLSVVVFVVLCVSTYLLRVQVQRLQAEINLLEQRDAKLRDELRTLESLPAQLAEVRQAQLSVRQSELAISLNDAGKVVGLDKQGGIAGLEGLSPAQQLLLKTALTSGRVKMPSWFADMKGADGPLMGPGERESFRLSTPIGTATRSNRPVFTWTALEGATSYKITVSDSNYKQVSVGEAISGTEWTPSNPLKPGVTYIWEVTAIKDGKSITAPAPPAPQAWFRVLDSTELNELEAASREHGRSHLFLGLLYAKAGLLADAEREFQALASANPESPIARKLLSSVKSLHSR